MLTMEGETKRRKNHISHNASLKTILSLWRRHVTTSFRNGCDGGTNVASADVSEIKPVISVLCRSRVRFRADGT